MQTENHKISGSMENKN